MTRIDPTVSFGWDYAPATGLPGDNFSIRWSGQVEAPVSGSYTFYTVSDDGVRLWVNGQQVIHNWTDHGPMENVGTPVSLMAGQKYDVRLEFYERSGGATARLLWSYSDQSKQVIPQGRLFPEGGGTNPTPPVNQAPSVSLTSPGAGASYTAPATVALAANASDSDGTVAKVEFFRGSTKLGEDTSSPYTFTWANVPAGSYSVSAKATDNAGAATTSPSNTFQVAPPTSGGTGSGTGLKGEYFANASLATPVAISRTDAMVDFEWSGGPAPGLPGDNFSVRWTGQVEAPATGEYVFCTISDDGVRLWVNGQQVIHNWTDHAPREDVSTPVRLTAGQKYDVRLEYYERGGGAMARLQWRYPGQAMTTVPRNRLYSQVSGIPPANQAPSVSLTSPGAGASYTAPATVALAANASDSDGIVAKVEFFQGSTKLGEDASSPYTFTWSSVPAGSYSLTAKATDNLGAVTTSGAVSIQVNPAANRPPTVALTKPTAGATYTAPATVTLEATAADPEGTVARVEFFQGPTKLGEDISSPYSFTWQNVSAGSYSVSAKAIDSGGAAATSAAVTFTVQAPSSSTLPAPTGLAAQGVWVESCCGGKPMAHIALSWNAVPGADSYNIYRNGEFYKGDVLTLSFKDMPLESGETHSYHVTAVDRNGESGKSNSATATAPFPGNQDAGFTAPTNLRIKGAWVNGASTDVLTWDPVPGAVSYNVYQYDDRILTGVKVPTCTIPTNIYVFGLTYTVTAVSSTGMESIPSNIVTANGAMNPASSRPGWVPATPSAPGNVTATPEWNADRPRIRLTWTSGNGSAYTYNVYRNGVRVAEGLWGLTYIDATAQPGVQYSYQVTGVNVPWLTPVEGERSPAVAATALRSPPAFSSAPVQILRVDPNDDSVMVHFAGVPGAVDYRCYAVGKPGSKKYSGGGLSIEMNAIDPMNGTFLVVEAVDKLGPFQKMDGFMGPGSTHDGMMNLAVNGMGDPSNIPNVLARSGQFHVTCQTRKLTGSQVFFDTFRNSKPFVPAPVSQMLLNLYGPRQIAALENDRWRILNARGDQANTQVFVMSDHFMDTFYDGGTPRTADPVHNHLASLVMQPKAVADISGGKVLHVTMEVDPHFSSRRWCDILVGEAGDELRIPGDFTGGMHLPTVKGNIFRYEVRSQAHIAQLFRNIGGRLTETPLIDGHHRGGMSARVRWDGAPLSNGTMHDLDRRHRFDLYLSSNRVRIEEEGVLVGDQTFPAGVTLPFSKVAVYFVHQLYHSGLERSENVIYHPKETYWNNHRPWADERHWDNMGFEVLDRFPE